MHHILTNWRLRAAALGAAQGRRYPREMREEALMLVEQAAAAGVSKAAACLELGIPTNTIDRWQRSASQFREVAIVEPSGTIEVVLGALRARLSIEDFALLVRRLS